MTNKEELEAKQWMKKHASELPPVEKFWEINHKYVVGGLVEDDDSGVLGIEKPEQEEDPESAGNTTPINRKSKSDILRQWQEQRHNPEGNKYLAQKRIAELEAQLRDYDDEKQTAERKQLLLSWLEDEKYWYQESYAEDTEEKKLKRQESWREYNLAWFGCESIEECKIRFENATMKGSKISKTHKNILGLHQIGNSQSQIANKLKISQQAVSKALFSAQKKLHAARRKFGGPHNHEILQLMHYSHTQGHTESAKEFMKQTGQIPKYCPNCSQQERQADANPTMTDKEIKLSKTCARCKTSFGAWRESCPHCGGELAIARKEKRKRYP
jgi:hypothetical protein